MSHEGKKNGTHFITPMCLSFIWISKPPTGSTNTFTFDSLPLPTNQQLAGPSAGFQLISQSNSSELIANFPFQTARCWPVLKLSGLFGQKGRRSGERGGQTRARRGLRAAVGQAIDRLRKVPVRAR